MGVVLQVVLDPRPADGKFVDLLDKSLVRMRTRDGHDDEEQGEDDDEAEGQNVRFGFPFRMSVPSMAVSSAHVVPDESDESQARRRRR